jgi:uncharacterized alpha-E superfamily protein
VDSAVFLLMPRAHEPGEFDNILWVNVLKSLSGFQMYRQHVHRRVTGVEVVRFLLQDEAFPRAVRHTVGEAEASLAHLPRHEAALRSVVRLQRRVHEARVDELALEDLHLLIDELQGELADIHGHIYATWFSLEQAATGQTQTQVQGA